MGNYASTPSANPSGAAAGGIALPALALAAGLVAWDQGWNKGVYTKQLFGWLHLPPLGTSAAATPEASSSKDIVDLGGRSSWNPVTHDVRVQGPNGRVVTIGKADTAADAIAKVGAANRPRTSTSTGAVNPARPQQPHGGTPTVPAPNNVRPIQTPVSDNHGTPANTSAPATGTSAVNPGPVASPSTPATYREWVTSEVPYRDGRSMIHKQSWTNTNGQTWDTFDNVGDAPITRTFAVDEGGGLAQNYVEFEDGGQEPDGDPYQIVSPDQQVVAEWAVDLENGYAQTYRRYADGHEAPEGTPWLITG